MASRLNPYISFPGNAREAMDFYKGVFGGKLTMSTFGELGGAQAPPDYADKVMHSMLETDRGFELMGADAPPGVEHTAGNNITISLSGDDADDLRSYWDKLSEGGSISVPFEKQMWGDVFGQCVDRFGVSWMVDIIEPQTT
jgi:PhnB protein